MFRRRPRDADHDLLLDIARMLMRIDAKVDDVLLRLKEEDDGEED